MQTLRAHAIPLAILFALCATGTFLKVHYLGVVPNSDYESYVETAQQLGGAPISDPRPERLLKPLAPLGVVLGAPMFGTEQSFLFEVIVFYFAFTLALYLLGFVFFQDIRLAFLAALLGAFSYPMLRYGLDLYTETGAQFFYVLSLVFMLRYVRTPSRTLLIANASVIAFGLLWKEYVVVSGICFGIALLSESVSIRRKLANLALFALVACLPSVVVQFIVYLAYHYTYFDWYVRGGASGFSTQFTLHNLLKSSGALIGLAWALVPSGIAAARTLPQVDRRFMLFLIPVSLIPLLWGNVSSRLFYVMAPALLLLALLGLRRFSIGIQYLLVGGIVLANIVWLAIVV